MVKKGDLIEKRLAAEEVLNWITKCYYVCFASSICFGGCLIGGFINSMITALCGIVGCSICVWLLRSLNEERIRLRIKYRGEVQLINQNQMKPQRQRITL